jgi:replicative DNA helicase
MKDNLDEQILAYAFYDKPLAIKVVDRVYSKFLKTDFQPLLKSISECLRKYNDIITIKMLERCESWDNSLHSIYSEVIKVKDSSNFDPTDFVLDLEDLKFRYKEQVLRSTGVNVFKRNWNGSGFDNIQEAVKTIKRASIELDKVEASKVYREGKISATASQSKDEYFKRKENPDVARGVCTGLKEFDSATNGLHPGELVLVGGESSSGKSALVMNMAINAWLGSNKIDQHIGDFKSDGVNVVYFTLEMPFDPFRRRFDACLAEIPVYSLRDGTLNAEEEARFKNSIKFQEQYKKEFYIVDIPRGCSVDMVEAKYLELMYEFVPQLVIIDYISLMKIDDSREPDWLSIGRISELLHEFCRLYNVPCITPVQLNRAHSGDSGLPSQHRVGRSIMLPQNANIMLNILTRQDEEIKLDMIINIAKLRDGSKGSFTLYKRLDLMRLYNDQPQGWNPELSDEDHI